MYGDVVIPGIQHGSLSEMKCWDNMCGVRLRAQVRNVKVRRGSESNVRNIEMEISVCSCCLLICKE